MHSKSIEVLRSRTISSGSVTLSIRCVTIFCNVCLEGRTNVRPLCVCRHRLSNTLTKYFIIKFYKGVCMIGVTVTVKLQNKLAKDSIVMSLKNVSQHLFSEDRGLLMRCFTNVSDTQVDMFHLWKDKSYQLKTRKEFSTKFWEDIKDMGGVVSMTEGECEVEMSSLINTSLVKMK